MAESSDKQFQTRVTLSGPERDLFLTLRDRLEGRQSDTWIASTLLASALRSIEEQNFAFALLLKLKVERPESMKTGKK